MRKLRIVVVALLVVVTALPAYAADELDEPNNGKAKVSSNLESPDTKRQGSKGPNLVAQSSGSWVYTTYVTKTYAGIRDYTWAHRVNWTGTGTNITAHSYYDFNAYNAVGVTWLGTISTNSFGYWSGGKKHYNDFEQGKYRHGWCPVCWHTYPYAETVVRADGAYWRVSWGA